MSGAQPVVLDAGILEAANLTTNERQAIDLINRGLSQRTAALALGISRSAVQSRLENAIRKIHAARGATA